MDQRINFPVAKALSDRGFLVMSEDCFYIKDEKIIESTVSLACEEGVFYYLRPTYPQVIDFLKLFGFRFKFQDTSLSMTVTIARNLELVLVKEIKGEEVNTEMDNILVEIINSIDLKDN